MQNNLSDLYRELEVYRIQENDYMVDKIQDLIDQTLLARRAEKEAQLNEIVTNQEKINTHILND